QGSTITASESAAIIICNPAGTPPTTAEAGLSKTVCSTTATLAGNDPGTDTGTWTKIFGPGTVTTPGAPNSEVTGLAVGLNVFRWTIQNGDPCVSEDDVVLILLADPMIVTEPSDQTAQAGNDVTFTIAATGTGLSYQWRKNGVDLAD